tara:strand:- start:531 stop:968 length:438 start_codon:yes stop_codon:yes gene_type:complete
MQDRSFLDTSVLLNLFDDDRPFEQAAARSLIGGPGSPTLVTSALVLANFYDQITSVFERSLEKIIARQALVDIAELTIIQIDSDLVFSAIETQTVEGISMQDSLSIEAAVISGCDRIATESLTHGEIIKGLKIENPSKLSHQNRG